MQDKTQAIALERISAIHITREQCRAARCYLDWSRHDLAKVCGVAPETIKNFETGIFSPTYSTEQAIIAAFEAQGLQFTDGGVRKRPLCPKCSQPLESPLAPAKETHAEIHSQKSPTGSRTSP
jgi:DNA-binding XRE family transcriptional regulator